MTTPTITLPLLVCLRCGHGDDCPQCDHAPMRWIQLGERRPAVCPQCHSAWWDRPRKAGKDEGK
jgi:primosomal protein N'